MKWKQPPIIKIYEALGAIADGRVKISSNTAQVYSSTGNKFYDVTYEPETNSIMANDNASYWKGYLGYPAIAYLMKIGVLEYQPELGKPLKGVAWKDLNQKFKNDFDKTTEHIFASLEPDQVRNLKEHAEKVSSRIKELDLNLLGEKIKPPEGY